MKRVLVALSGGIDSAATVLILRRQGLEPEGLYLDITGDELTRRKAVDAAAAMDIRLHVEPVGELFRHEIMQYILNEHRAGRTPSPCPVCNPLIKWRVLAEVADRQGIEKIATGHYIRIIEKDGCCYVGKGIDPVKDQSYYLWGLDQDILRRAITPLGEYSKTQVRELLSGFGFNVLATGGESMGICFLGGRSYDSFLAENLAGEIEPGDVVTKSCEKIGTHRGYQLYTIGQKKGFEVASGLPMQVVAVDSEKNLLVVSDDPDDLFSSILWGRDWRADLRELAETPGLRVIVRGLGRNPEGTCSVAPDDQGLLRVALNGGKAWAAAPGQPMVFYDGDRVVGGAYIVKSE